MPPKPDEPNQNITMSYMNNKGLWGFVGGMIAAAIGAKVVKSPVAPPAEWTAPNGGNARRRAFPPFLFPYPCITRLSIIRPAGSVYAAAAAHSIMTRLTASNAGS